MKNEENRRRLVFGLTGEIHFSIQVLNLRCQAELEKVQATYDDVNPAEKRTREKVLHKNRTNHQANVAIFSHTY